MSNPTIRVFFSHHQLSVLLVKLCGCIPHYVVCWLVFIFLASKYHFHLKKENQHQLVITDQTGGWRDGWGVKSVYCAGRRSEFGFQNPCWVAHNPCHTNSKRSKALSPSFLGYLHSNAKSPQRTHMPIHMYTNIPRQVHV